MLIKIWLNNLLSSYDLGINSTLWYETQLSSFYLFLFITRFGGATKCGELGFILALHSEMTPNGAPECQK